MLNLFGCGTSLGCRAKGHPGRSGREEPCSARYAPAHQLDELVWQDLCALLSEPEQVAAALARAHGGGWLPQDLQARREQLRQGRGGLQRQLERLTEAFLLGVIPLPEYQRRRQATENRLQVLEVQTKQLESRVDRQAQLAGWASSAEEFCRRIATGLVGADFAQRRELVELLVDRVIVADAEVEIHYVIPVGPDGERGRFCHLRKDSFDPVAVGVDPIRAGDRGIVPLRRDRRPGAHAPDVLAETLAGVASVAHHPLGHARQLTEQRDSLRQLMRLTVRDPERDGTGTVRNFVLGGHSGPEGGPRWHDGKHRTSLTRSWTSCWPAPIPRRRSRPMACWTR
ncbi:hypothetical protein J2X36_004764 [Methylobacterium sp. BE186]|nr:hypothetical protein [Methylobacterium sp. BE186]